jgi:signal transduction histidine kinase
MKLRPKILSLVIGILLVAFVALSIPLYWYTRSALEDELDKRLISMAQIAAMQVRGDLLNNLVKEPALLTVRSALEQELSFFLIDGVEGIAIYSQGGDVLARANRREIDIPSLPVLLEMLTGMADTVTAVVSELYQLSGGEYFKAAATSIDVDAGTTPVLVVWGGADFMAVIDQMVGSVFWIVLVSVVVAVSLAIVFSRSLIRPVTDLSSYAKSIQKNIYTDKVSLGRSDELGDLNQSLAEMHTEIRQHEESMKQLLSGIAHEIKNPLGGMEIYAGLLEEALAEEASEEDMAERRSYLGKVIRELSHLKQIVLEYLDYARPLKGHPEQLKLEVILDDIHRILEPEIRQKEVNYHHSGNGVILGDESKLRRVFVNLLKNSLEAVDENGTIAVTVECKDSRVSVEVSDNGRGIPKADIDKIFDPYFTTQDKGYGLGLAIVKNIVDEMNGTIIVKSEADRGTEFTLSFAEA